MSHSIVNNATINNAIMIIGPNGVGKTKIAYELARRHSGEVINLDRTYLYKGFPITTGLQDALGEQGVGRHFYEMLEPQEVSFSADDFVEMVCKKNEEVLQRRNFSIAEGASTLYVPALLELNSKKRIFRQVLGLRFPPGYDVRAKYSLRIEEAFANGLADEISMNLEKYQNSHLIKECHSSVPTVKYLEGEITLSEAKEAILNRCLDYKDRQLELFSKFPEIRWIEASTFSESLHEANQIIAKMNCS